MLRQDYYPISSTTVKKMDTVGYQGSGKKTGLGEW
jgi:hypothetical protein